MPYTELPNSSFMDFASWRSGASAPTGGPVVTSFTLNVALILDRANDPSTLLNANWASRQQQLDTLNDNGTLWSTYGADTGEVQSGEGRARRVGHQDGRAGGGRAGRAERLHLFGRIAHHLGAGRPHQYRQAVRSGLRPARRRQQLALGGQPLAPRRLGEHARRQGPVVRHAPTSTRSAAQSRQRHAGAPAAGLAEPGQRQHQSDQHLSPADRRRLLQLPVLRRSLESRLGHRAANRHDRPGRAGRRRDSPGRARSARCSTTIARKLGINTPAQWRSVAPGGEQYPTNIQPPAFNPAGERSLDVGVVTAINPQSPLVLYAGSGYSAGAQSQQPSPPTSRRSGISPTIPRSSPPRSASRRS